MRIEKKLGKLRLELNLSKFQISAISAWIICLLIIPISVDQLLKSQAPEDSSAYSVNSEIQAKAGDTENIDIFTYTIKPASQRELVSIMTLVFGTLFAFISLGTIIYFFKESHKKEKSIFESLD